MNDFHMSSEQFRRHGHAVIDWIAEYLRSVESRPVRSNVRPGAIAEQLPEHAPEHGEPFDAVLRDLDALILPGITHWQSPNFFAYFPSNTSGPSILGELLSAGLGVQGMSWVTSPACTELETRVLDWLVDALGLPARFRSSASGGGVIQDTASSATLCALLAARERATNNDANRRGVPPGLTAYASADAHSMVEKAVRIAGLGDEQLRRIPVDAQRALRPDALAAAMGADRAAGLTPCFVCATVGTTSTNGLDPIAAIAAHCQTHGAWLHVDAAMSGTAALCPELRFIHDGVESADSYNFNPHKWMFTNFDCDCFYVADRSALIRALGILPEYLKNAPTQSGAVFDYRDWHVPLGRRFRALKLWMVLRHYGTRGLQHHIREHVRLARSFADWVRDDHDFELAFPPPLNLVCFRHRAGDAFNERLMEHLNDSGRLYLTHTRIEDRLLLRMSIGQTHTAERHVSAAWALIRETAAGLTAH